MKGLAQCDPNVPLLEVDLTSDPAATFFSPSIIREGNCCGTTAPDRCISFNITLHEDAQGIIFDICDGAIPPGALFYQIECGPQIAVGDVLCLTGPGPHLLTFCKPGNNNNVYCITSVPAPAVGPNTYATEGCTAEISSTGYDPTSISWTSVAPGAPGDYDEYLECPTCDTTLVFAPDNIPEFIDYQICGLAIGGCSTEEFCDTVRVYLANTLDVTIEPTNPGICEGETQVTVTASATGGFPPYNFEWSNNTTGETTDISEPGTYSVTVSDTTDCSTASITFEVIEYDQPISVDAGPDSVVCSLAGQIQLNGSYTGADSSMWVGGEGNFIPDRNDPNAIYEPSANEIENGTLTLVLTVLPASDCPGSSDEVTFSIAPFTAEVTSSFSNVTCNGLSDGEISLSVNGENGPYSFQWAELVSDQPTVSSLAAGTYSVTIFNQFGCSTEEVFEIDQPEPLVINVAEVNSPLCTYSGLGNAEITIEGGTPPYQVLWSGDPGSLSNSELEAGSHTVQVIDDNNCENSVEIEIASPNPIEISGDTGFLICPGEDATISASASGGFGDLIYIWSNGLDNSGQQTVTPSETTTYTVYAQDENGCSSDTLEILMEVPTMDLGQLEISEDIAICPGASTEVSADYQGEYGPYTYFWNQGLSASPGPHTVSPDADTYYVVSVSDPCNNLVTDSVLITIQDIPRIDIETSTDAGCSPLAITLIDDANSNPTFDYQWMLNGENVAQGNPSEIIVEEPGVHVISVMVTTSEGCTTQGQSEMQIEVFPSPVASFSASTWVTDIDDPSFTFLNTTEGSIANLNWSIEGSSIEDLEEINHTFQDTGTYEVGLFITNDFGCSDSILQSVTVNPVYDIIIPNAFTPTDSGDNGLYDPSSTSNSIFYPFADYVENFRMSIFNRWGELIFETKNINYGWNGTYRGSPCPQDVYVYKAEFEFSDGHKVTKTGDITLFR
jgi:gliding motility-associated-like protein